jgi:hypothetical protein
MDGGALFLSKGFRMRERGREGDGYCPDDSSATRMILFIIGFYRKQQ